LLVQSSDWQFIISTGAVTDYAIRRFNGHADACDRLFNAIRDGLVSGDLTNATNLASELRAQDDLFPDVLESVRAVLSGIGNRESGIGAVARGTGNGEQGTEEPREAAGGLPG
jgi:1,4-alpha-glucan branching enzyme